MATKSAVIVLCEEAVLIWAIPPLSPQLPDFFHHNSTHMPPPLFTLPLSDGIVRLNEWIRWKTLPSWHFGSSLSLYFDILCVNSDLHKFQIMLEPDLSTASLHVIIWSHSSWFPLCNLWRLQGLRGYHSSCHLLDSWWSLPSIPRMWSIYLRD